MYKYDQSARCAGPGWGNLMAKLFRANEKNPLWVTSLSERMNYYLYFCGQNMIYTFVTSFLTAALMFELGSRSLGIVAGITLAVKVWDAVNDAIFGVIFDKVHFRSGRRFLPWIKISLFAIPATTILLFTMPHGASDAVKLVWYAVAYMLWDTAYTFCDAPIFGLVTAMSERLDERTTLQSNKSIWSGVGTGLSTIIGTILASEGVGLNYSLISVIVAVIALGTMLPLMKTAKERYPGQMDENFTVRKMLRYLVHNKYLLIFFLGQLFYSSLELTRHLNLFVSYYLFNNSNFSLIITGLSAVPMLIFALLVPKLAKRFDKIRIMQVSALGVFAMDTVTWLFGWQNAVLFVVLSILRYIPIGLVGVLLSMFTPDCAEYGRFKSGIDAKGITFSIQTFMSKLTQAFAQAIVFVMFLVIKWNDVSSAKNFDQLKNLAIQQSDGTLKGLWFMYMMFPAIGALIAAGVWTRYKLKENDVQLITDVNTGKSTRAEVLPQLSIKDEFAAELDPVAKA